MRGRLLVVALVFSVALNAAAVIAFVLARSGSGHAACSGGAGAEWSRLGLTPEQEREFTRLDQDFHARRRMAQERLRALRADLIKQVLDAQATPAAWEQLLSASGMEQAALQRSLIESLRDKHAVLTPEQQKAYRVMVEQMACGCGCSSCTGHCH